MNESDQPKKEENPLMKGWNDFVKNINTGFQQFQENLQNQLKANQENLEKNKQNASKFFTKIQDDWNKKVENWNKQVQDSQLKNQSQWEATKQQIRMDIENWEDKRRQDLKDGLKWWSWQSVKGAYLFLLIMIPIIIVLFLVFYIISKFFPFLFQ